MKSIKRLRNNLLSLSAANVVAKALGAVLYVILARYLGPEQFGIYSLAVSFGLIFGLLANLGLDPLIIKDVARDPTLSETYFSHAVLLKLAGGTLSFLLLVAVTLVLGYKSEIRTTIIIFASLFFIMPLNATQEAIFKAHQKMGYTALMNALRPFVNIILMLVAIALGFGVQAIAGIHILRAFILFVFFYFFVLKRHFCHFSIPENGGLFLPILKSASPFVFIGVVYIINAKVDIFIISKLVGIKAVGWYSAANELVMMLFTIPTILSTVLFPIFSADYGRAEMTDLAQKGHFVFKLLNVMGVPCGMGIFVLAPEIIDLVFGLEYVGAVIVLRILSLNVCFFFANSALNWLLTAMDQVKVVLKVNMFALGVNVLLDLMLVPHYGYAAAAVGMFVSIFCSNIFKSWFLSKKLKGVFILKSFVRPFIASFIMVGLLLFFRNCHLFVKIGVGIAGYGVAVIVLSIFGKRERAVLRHIFAFGGA